MGWEMAVVGALGYAQYEAQGAAGKFNKAVQDRNAIIAEQEKRQIEQQNVWDLQNFNEKFNQLEGQVTTRLAKSGVTMEGSGLRVMRKNAEQAELQKHIITYNSQVESSKKMEQANMFRIQGEMAMNQARSAQMSTLFSTGSSLLRMNGGFGTKDLTSTEGSF
jgi:hypothetical protein